MPVAVTHIQNRHRTQLLQISDLKAANAALEAQLVDLKQLLHASSASNAQAAATAAQTEESSRLEAELQREKVFIVLHVLV